MQRLDSNEYSDNDYIILTNTSTLNNTVNADTGVSSNNESTISNDILVPKKEYVDNQTKIEYNDKENILSCNRTTKI